MRKFTLNKNQDGGGKLIDSISGEQAVVIKITFSCIGRMLLFDYRATPNTVVSETDLIQYDDGHAYRVHTCCAMADVQSVAALPVVVQSVAAEEKLSFEQQLIERAQQALLRKLSSEDAIGLNYDNRLKLPAEFMAQVWSLIDKDKLKQRLADKIGEELVDRIVNHMAAELATDIKTILSNKDRREALRAVARENIDRICKK